MIDLLADIDRLFSLRYMRRFIIVILPLIASCGTALPTPDDCKALAMPEAILERCVRGAVPNGEYVDDLACWPFSEPQRMQGLWLIGLEASEFWEGMRQPATIPPGVGQTWLQSDLLESDDELNAAAQGTGTRMYKVDIEGRRSLCEGSFGHFGIYPNQVIATHFHAMERVR